MNKQINILSNIFVGTNGRDSVKPEAWLAVETAADVLVNRLSEIDRDSVTNKDARLVAKRLIAALESTAGI